MLTGSAAIAALRDALESSNESFAAFHRGELVIDYDLDSYREALAIQVGIAGPSESALQTLQGVADGQTLQEVADDKGVVLSTTRAQMSQVRCSLVARTRPAAVYAGLILGVIWVKYPNGERGLSTGTVAANGHEYTGDHDEQLINMLAQGFYSEEMRQAAGYEFIGSVSHRFGVMRNQVKAAPTRSALIRRAFEIGIIGAHSSPPLWDG